MSFLQKLALKNYDKIIAVSKATKKTNNKFILKSHPFQLKLNDTDLETLSKVYKKIYKNLFN